MKTTVVGIVQVEIFRKKFWGFPEASAGLMGGQIIVLF